MRSIRELRRRAGENPVDRREATGSPMYNRGCSYELFVSWLLRLWSIPRLFAVWLKEADPLLRRASVTS
jgi:hypothetical protein